MEVFSLFFCVFLSKQKPKKKQQKTTTNTKDNCHARDPSSTSTCWDTRSLLLYFIIIIIIILKTFPLNFGLYCGFLPTLFFLVVVSLYATTYFGVRDSSTHSTYLSFEVGGWIIFIKKQKKKTQWYPRCCWTRWTGSRSGVSLSSGSSSKTQKTKRNNRR